KPPVNRKLILAPTAWCAVLERLRKIGRGFRASLGHQRGDIGKRFGENTHDDPPYRSYGDSPCARSIDSRSSSTTAPSSSRARPPNPTSGSSSPPPCLITIASFPRPSR